MDIDAAKRVGGERLGDFPRRLLAEIRTCPPGKAGGAGLRESPTWAHPILVGRRVLINDATTLAVWTVGQARSLCPGPEQADQHFPHVVTPRRPAVAFGHLYIVHGMTGAGQRLSYAACCRNIRVVVLPRQNGHSQAMTGPPGNGGDLVEAEPTAGNHKAHAIERPG